MEEITLKISNSKHKTTLQWRLSNARKVKNFNKSLILLYRFGFVGQLSPELVRIGIEKYPGFGGLLINPGPIWHLAALGKEDGTYLFRKKKKENRYLAFFCHKISRKSPKIDKSWYWQDLMDYDSVMIFQTNAVIFCIFLIEITFLENMADNNLITAGHLSH